jgi:hypothetical protein
LVDRNVSYYTQVLHMVHIYQCQHNMDNLLR